MAYTMYVVKNTLDIIKIFWSIYNLYKYKHNKISINNIGCGIYNCIYIYGYSILTGSEAINYIHLKPNHSPCYKSF